MANIMSCKEHKFWDREHNLTKFRAAKFPAATSITLFFPASQGADNTRIYYVGFLGQFTEVCTSYFTIALN